MRYIIASLAAMFALPAMAQQQSSPNEQALALLLKREQVAHQQDVAEAFTLQQQVTTLQQKVAELEKAKASPAAEK